MSILLATFWLQVRAHLASQVATEGASILLFIAAAVLIYRTFRERYLLVWLAGWVLYYGYREGLLVADRAPLHNGLALGLSHAAFAVAVGCFSSAVLLYTNSRKLLPPVAIVTAIAVDVALVQHVWFSGSFSLTVLFQLLYRTVAIIAALRLFMFSRGRREIGRWLLAFSFLFLHADLHPHGAASLWANGADSVAEVLLGLSMLIVVLDDSNARTRRLAVATSISNAIADAQDHDSMIRITLEKVRSLIGAEAAWCRLLVGERLVLTQHVGLSEEYANTRHEIAAAESHTETMLYERAPIKLKVSALSDEPQRLLAAQGFEHVVSIPITGKSTVLGALTLGLRRKRSYTADEMDFLAVTANGIGLAIENMKMLEQVKASQRQWTSTFDSIEDLIFVHDDAGQIVRMNRAFSRRIGHPIKEIVGRQLSAVLPNASAGCPYCLRNLQTGAEGPDPCYGGYSLVSTSSIANEGDAAAATVHIITDTSERRAADERYRLFFEEVHEGVFVASPDGRFLDCNMAFVRLLGYQSRGEVLEGRIAENIYVVPEERASLLSLMTRNGYVRNYEVKLRRKDGSTVTVLENSFATRDANGNIQSIQGFVVDISDKKRAEEEIRRRNRELRALNAIAVIAAQSFDLDEILHVTLRQLVAVFSAEAGAIYLFDHDSNSLRRRASWARRSDDYPSVVENSEEFHKTVVANHREIIGASELELLGQAGKELESCTWVVLWSQSKPLGIVGVAGSSEHGFLHNDIELLAAIARQLATTIDKVRLYEETSRAYEDLRRTQEQLLQSEKMSAVGQLISGVAHELNNPLTAILGYAQLLEGEPMDERPRDFVAKLYRQAQRTQRIVQNLLSFARQRKPVRSSIDLRKVLDDTVALREFDLKLYNITVVRDYQDVPPVFADAHQFEQVFLNIVNNAVDAMLDAARGGTLRVRIFTEQNFACVEIRDSGGGIKEPTRVFDPFYTTKKVGKGTGLGLSICYGIVKEHGGDIIAFNHAEGGAVFRVRVPIAAAVAPAAAPAPVPAVVQPVVISGRILVVEDEQSLLDYEREVLSGAGAEVVAVASVEKAIALIQTNPVPFDVIIASARMPGRWTAKDILLLVSEQRPGTERTLVLTMAAGEDHEFRDFIAEHRLITLMKPFKVSELLEVVRSITQKSSTAVL